MTEYYVWTSPNGVEHLCEPDTGCCITCGQWHWATDTDASRDAGLDDEEGYEHADR